MNRAAALEAVSYATWTAEESATINGWLVTATGGLSRRVNSARCEGGAVVDEETLALLEQWFDDRSVRFVVRQTPLTAASTSQQVQETWGFRHVDETVVMSGRIDGSPVHEVQVTSVGDPGFFNEIAEMNGRRGATKDTFGRLLGRVAPNAAGLWVPGVAAAVVAVHEQAFAVFSLAVDPAARRSGLASDLMRSAARWAGSRDADECMAQVVGTNSAALRLYDRLGLSETYRYRYLQSPSDTA